MRLVVITQEDGSRVALHPDALQKIEEHVGGRCEIIHGMENYYTLEVTQEMFWLAWQSSQCLGMGILQDNPTATKEDIWKAVTGQTMTDYVIPQGSHVQPTADYVFGRMMKMSVEICNDGIIVPEWTMQPDYQSWAKRYPTYIVLFEEAQKCLKAKELSVETNP